MGLTVAPCSPPTRTIDEVLAHFGESDGGALEVLTKALDVSVGDEAGGEAEEGFVDVVASF
ncbi:hypothetical protein, partial [Streptomyces sp. NPDC048266]|uniref:hypothetical protein n=1 Tax=Streptomyces sp. NPDC048266 TaxID=3155787 RepID=UPI0033E07B90